VRRQRGGGAVATPGNRRAQGHGGENKPATEMKVKSKLVLRPTGGKGKGKKRNWLHKPEAWVKEGREDEWDLTTRQAIKQKKDVDRKEKKSKGRVDESKR